MPTIVISENSGADYSGVTDTQIKESAPTTSYGSTSFMEATSYDTGDRTLSLVSFNSPSLGGALTVSSATLEIRQADMSTGSRTIDVYEMKRAFTNSATWNTYDGTNAWQTAGGFGANDRGASALDSRSVAASVGYKSWSSSALIAYVQAQLNAGNPMRFWVMRNPDNAYDFVFNSFSQSGDTDGNRPRLTVVYTLDPTSVLFAASVF
jgi:hypothetical protein